MINKLIDSKSFDENILISIEELSELTKALTKYQRHRMSGEISKLHECRNEIVKECVDVDVILNCLKELFYIGEVEYKKEYDIKMKRNIERLK